MYSITLHTIEQAKHKESSYITQSCDDASRLLFGKVSSSNSVLQSVIAAFISASAGAEAEAAQESATQALKFHLGAGSRNTTAGMDLSCTC